MHYSCTAIVEELQNWRKPFCGLAQSLEDVRLQLHGWLSYPVQ